LDPREEVSSEQKDKESGGLLKKGTYYERYKFEETLIIENAITDFFGHYQKFHSFFVFKQFSETVFRPQVKGLHSWPQSM
jgi:hypothetical protein